MNLLRRVSNQSEYTANILCVDQSLDIGAGQVELLKIIPALTERGWRTSVAIPGEGTFSALIRRRGHCTHNLHCGTYTEGRRRLSEVVKYAREFPRVVKLLTELVSAKRMDLLYVNGPRLVPPAAWVAWRTATPLVFHCHRRLVQHSAIALTGQALELASAHVISSSEYAADPLREYIESQGLRIIYSGIKGVSTATRRFPGRIRRIGVVGRVEEAKGQLEFVQAARLVLKQIPDCRFTIIGTPPTRGSEYYGRLIAASDGLPIDFLGRQEDLGELYSELDLLVVPSRAHETSTRAVLEAYSAEVPVVAFPVGGMAEILHNDETGFLAEAPTVDALARRILSVLQMNKATVWGVVKRARKEWHDHFTLRTYREKVCDALASAMHRPQLAPRSEPLSRAAALTN